MHLFLPRVVKGECWPVSITTYGRGDSSVPIPVCVADSDLYKVVVVGLVWYAKQKKEEEEDEETKIINAVKRQLLSARRAHKRSNYRKAEKSYHNALALLIDSELAENQVLLEARAVTLDKLANLYLEQKKWLEAELVFKETMRVMLHAGSPKDSDAFIEISLKLGRVYHNRKRYDLAEPAFAWCIDTIREKLAKEECKETRAMLGLGLTCRALFYSYRQQHDKAVVDYTEQLGIAETVHGKQSIQVAVAYSNLAVEVDACRDSERALALINTSLEMADALLARATDSAEVADLKQHEATFHVNLGIIHSNNGRYPLALSAYDQAESLADGSEDEHLIAQIKQGRDKCKSSVRTS